MNGILESGDRVNAWAYWYNFASIALSANGTGTQSLTLDTGTEFEWWGLRVSCSQSGADDSTPNNVQIQLRDNSTGNLLSNNQLSERLIAPISGNNLFPKPLIIPPATTLVCDYTNLTAATNNVVVALIGYKRSL